MSSISATYCQYLHLRSGGKKRTVFRVVRPSDYDVLECGGGVDAEPLGDRLDTIGPEGTLGVNVRDLALASSHLDGELSGDAKSVAKLSLAGAELAVD